MRLLVVRSGTHILLATAGLVATAPLAAAQTIGGAEPSAQDRATPAAAPDATMAPSAVSSPDSTLARAPSTSRADWTGFYVGAHAGVSSGSSAWSATQPGLPKLWGPLSFFRPV